MPIIGSNTPMRHLTLGLQVLLCVCLLIVGTFAQPVREGEVRGKDVSLHYKIYGDKGDYVILLAGGPGSDVRYMQPIADALSNSHRCVMLEQRGTGRSQLDKINSETVKMERYVEDIELVRQRLNARKVTLIGNSWGMMLALLYSSSYPDQVSKVITVGSGPITDKYGDIFGDNLRVRFLPEEKALRSEWSARLKADPSLFVTANYERDKAGMPAYYYDREKGLKAARELLPGDYNYHLSQEFHKAYPKFDLRPQLKKIKAPILMIQGRQDPAGESNILEANKLIKGSLVKFIERCGHTPWEEKPEETFQLIRSFLAKGSKARI